MGEPRELPILFSAEMVRAILAGAKTQTRRPVHPSQIPTGGDRTPRAEWCPIAAVGDRLWVREAWNLGRPLRNVEGTVDDEMLWPGPIPKADPRGARLFDDWCLGFAADGDEGPWRPSIHMPRWASRLTLDVLGVRVERLQDITEADANAEGVIELDGWLDEAAICAAAKAMNTTACDSRAWFATLWDSLGYCATWAANPWVWVVDFRRVEVPRG